MKTIQSKKRQIKGWQLYGESAVAASFVVLCLLSGIVSSAAQAKVYRIVDEYGNVSFTDQPPQDAEAEEIEVPKVLNSYDGSDMRERNKVTLQKYKAQEDIESVKEKGQRQQSQSLALQLQHAQLALQQAKIVRAGDFIGTKTGGSRPSPSYLKRVSDAEQKVKRLQEQLNQQ